MQYNVEKYSKILELDKVLNILANEATLEDAADICRNIIPSFDYYEVEHNQQCTAAAYELMSKFTAPSFGGAVNIKSLLKKADVGACLTIKELLNVATTLKIIRNVKQWRKDIIADISTVIDEYFEVLSPNKYFEDKIFSAVKNESELNDNASDKLFSLRRKISNASMNIREKLDKIVRNSEKSKFLQDAIITQRDGRFVVPVKAEHRGEIPGIVHDTSGSGSTVFIEPMGVVEVNNELRVLEVEEREEVHRILCEFSSEAAAFYESAAVSYDALIELCVIFAKASLAYKMHACTPVLNNQGKIDLISARHPLIDQKSVVPISVSLGLNFNTLVITGPNTGGKTVTLKTLGLLCLMAMCGLMIPAEQGSKIAVFDRILADIGDEQSIEQSLSTFSAHMVNIVSVLKLATNNSLVLLDELGAGTDPIEGAALAKAILIELGARGAKIASTTHYAELKTYALDTENVENASCEFSVSDLKPTYKLLIGVPGRSNAFAISKRLGLDNSIIENAKGHISEENQRFENVIASLEKARQNADKERQRVTRLKHELQEEKAKSQQSTYDANKEQEKILMQTRAQAERILEQARYKANVLLTELEDTKKKLNAETAAKQVSYAKKTIDKTITDIERISDPVIKKQEAKYVLPRELKVNDEVLIFDLGKKAVITNIDKAKSKAYVTAGNMNIWVDIKNLRLIEEKTQPKKENKKISGITSRVERNATSEIDMRGMSVDEGLLELDRYIDNAVMAGIGSITIIHGKGTGVLRKAVHEHLKHHRSINSYRLGVFGEGEAGVTIAEIK